MVRIERSESSEAREEKKKRVDRIDSLRQRGQKVTTQRDTEILEVPHTKMMPSGKGGAPGVYRQNKRGERKKRIKRKRSKWEISGINLAMLKNLKYHGKGNPWCMVIYYIA